MRKLELTAWIVRHRVFMNSFSEPMKVDFKELVPVLLLSFFQVGRKRFFSAFPVMAEGGSSHFDVWSYFPKACSSFVFCRQRRLVRMSLSA